MKTAMAKHPTFNVRNNITGNSKVSGAERNFHQSNARDMPFRTIRIVRTNVPDNTHFERSWRRQTGDADVSMTTQSRGVPLKVEID